MKRFICILLLAALCISIPFSALAATANYSSTQQFIDKLDEEGLQYTLRGLNDSDDEQVTLSYSSSGYSYTIRYFFHPDQDLTSMYVWNLITFDESDKQTLFGVCNQLNYDYKFMRFYVDETDNTITAYADMAYGENDVGEILYELTGYFRRILDIGYEQFKPYDTAS